MMKRNGFTLIRRLGMTVGIVLMVLGFLSLTAAWLQAPPLRLPPAHPSAIFMPRHRPATPFEASLQSAREWRSRAMLEADREREAQAAWDPRSVSDADLKARRELWDTASQRSLRQARLSAQQALRLARSPEEKYEALLVMARLEHYLGHYQAELQIARQLMKQRPEDARSQDILKRTLSGLNRLNAAGSPGGLER
jgi:hypothetical protein